MSPVPPSDTVGSAAPAGETVLRLHAEQVIVDRRRVEGETVRVATTTRLREQTIEEPLIHERVEVERVAIGRVVDAVPPVRQDGDVTVLSVVEEILVIERRLVLKEEVRLRRVRVTETHRETVSLREQTVEATRSAPEGAAGRSYPINKPRNT